MNGHIHGGEQPQQLLFTISTDGKIKNACATSAFPVLLPAQQLNDQPYTTILPPVLAELLWKYLQPLLGGEVGPAEFLFSLNDHGRFCLFGCRLFALPPIPAVPTSIQVLINCLTPTDHCSPDRPPFENLLLASAAANEELLRNHDLITAISFGLNGLGNAVNADRCYIFENYQDEKTRGMTCRQRLEWNSGAADPQIDNPELQNFPHSSGGIFFEVLQSHQHFCAYVEALPEGELKDILKMQGIVSILALPIHVDDEFWGFVGFDDCRSERRWSGAEISILASFATSIANAIVRKRIEDDLLNSRNVIIAANKVKSDFLANITHEIRTPLHGVMGYSEMLASFKFPPKQAQHFENLRNSATRLSRLINVMLDLASKEPVASTIRRENCQLRTVLDVVLAAVDHLTSRNQNTLESSVADDVPEFVFVDPSRLHQVIVNLLSNALKFTNRGRVGLHVTCADDKLVFRVEDTGIGMSGDQLKQLFQPFEQLDSSVTKKYEGSGLGLSISNRILTQLGSSIEVQSILGKGSCFSFAIPLETIRPQNMDPQGGTAETCSLPKNILIVEDNPLSMHLAVTMLQLISATFVIHQAESGSSALEMIKGGLVPDLAFMDIQMPEMDGFETTRRMLNIASAPMKIIALTATATKEIKQQCHVAGMVDFLTKPFSRKQLQKVIQRHV